MVTLPLDFHFVCSVCRQRCVLIGRVRRARQSHRAAHQNTRPACLLLSDHGGGGPWRAWIEAVLGEPLGDETLHVILKSGVVLCNLINALKPGSIKNISTKKMPFMQMENISNYLAAVGPSGLGIPAFEAFMPIDLYEEQNMQAVVLNVCHTDARTDATQGSNPEPADLARDHSPRATALQGIHAGLLLTRLSLGQIHSLGRKAQSFYEGATLGVKMSTESASSPRSR